MGRPRIEPPCLLRPKEAKEERDELRECPLSTVIGEGLLMRRGDFVEARPGEAVLILEGNSASGGGDRGYCSGIGARFWRRCWNSGGCCPRGERGGSMDWVVIWDDFLVRSASCSATAAYSWSISNSFFFLSSSMTDSSNVTTLLCTDPLCLCLLMMLPQPLAGFGEGHCCWLFFTGLMGLGPHGFVEDGCIWIGCTGLTISMPSEFGDDCAERRRRRPTVRMPMQTKMTKRRYEPKIAPSSGPRSRGSRVALLLIVGSWSAGGAGSLSM